MKGVHAELAERLADDIRKAIGPEQTQKVDLLLRHLVQHVTRLEELASDAIMFQPRPFITKDKLDG